MYLIIVYMLHVIEHCVHVHSFQRYEFNKIWRELFIIFFCKIQLDNTAFRPNALIKENDIAFVDKSSIIFKDFAFIWKINNLYKISLRIEYSRNLRNYFKKSIAKRCVFFFLFEAAIIKLYDK